MNLNEILNVLDPAILNYEQWLKTGIAIKNSGGTVQQWEQWSMKDFNRYKAGECERKWHTFNGANDPVTTATLISYAQQQGADIRRNEDTGRELTWDEEIGGGDDLIVRTEWLQDAEINEPGETWNGKADLIKYLKTLFQAEDHVGYVTDCWQDEKGKYLPKKGNFDRTAGQLISELQNKTIENVIGDYNPECGAWIRFNPLNGEGVRDENVTDYRYALVESDTLTGEKQIAIYRELELPCAAMVHSGGKSVHAIIRIDAHDLPEYKKRVDFLYEILKKNGLPVDRQNRNPSRLSRLPGVTRNGKKQFLISVNTGKSSWQEWREWIEDQNDDLPKLESVADCWNNMPPLADELITGILRTGHKMLIAGPSKSGKSFLLLNLAIAVAEGRKWLSWQCSRGGVLYVNLELDRASAMNRLKMLYQTQNIPPKNVDKIMMWNLRGKSMPMDKLAPRLIRRASKNNLKLIIIDPIYKVITGDENAADQMAKFCNQFDRVCAELGVAVVYCHHHSKGAQGQKQAHDRASGSGVFARDPDALIDIVELELSDKRVNEIINNEKSAAISAFLDRHKPDWREHISPDITTQAENFLHEARMLLQDITIDADLASAVFAAGERAEAKTGWRIEGILREFRTFQPLRVWFDYPLHTIDDSGLLTDAKAEGELPSKTNRYDAINDNRAEGIEAIKCAYETMKSLPGNDGKVPVKDIAERCGVVETTIKRRIETGVKLTTLRYKKGVIFDTEKAE